MSHGALGHAVTGSAGRDLYRVTARGIVPHDGEGSAPRCLPVCALFCAQWPRTAERTLPIRS